MNTEKLQSILKAQLQKHPETCHQAIIETFITLMLEQVLSGNYKPE
jgi:hypothetical protein